MVKDYCVKFLHVSSYTLYLLNFAAHILDLCSTNGVEIPFFILTVNIVTRTELLMISVVWYT